MHTVRTIVVGMDWSPAALDAWGEISGVAATFGSQVVFVHAIPADLVGPERDEVRLRAEELLRDMLTGHGPAGPARRAA